MTPPVTSPYPKHTQGFTLVEILVSMAIFVLLAVLLGNITNGTSRVTLHQIRHVNMISSARGALDTLGADIKTMITLGGSTILFKPGDMSAEPPSSDILRLVSASKPTSDVVRPRFNVASWSIEWRSELAEQDAIPMLVRTHTPLTWPDKQDDAPTDYDLKTALRERSPEPEDVTIASSKLFRFEITWLRRDGTFTRDPRGLHPEESSMTTDDAGYIWIDLNEVIGFTLSVAAFEGGQDQPLTHDDYEHLQKALLPLNDNEHTTEGNRVPARQWQGAVPSLTPVAARRDVRILQRTYFFLN